MSDDPQNPDDDDVGYGKPPKSTQFQPGKSGNPKGRPKGPGNLHKMITKHAGTKVTVVINGTEKKMAKMDVVISAMFSKASKGDVSAARLLSTLVLASAQLSGEEYQSGFTEADFAAILAEKDWQEQLVKLGKETSDDDL